MSEILIKRSVEGDIEDVEGGSSEGGGGITLSVEQLNAYLLASFNKERRQRSDGQRKFGPCPLSEDPNHFLVKKTTKSACGELPQVHPLLAQSQQFSGDDPKITANPLENPKARENYPELRLANQLQKNLELARRRSVTLVR